MTNRSLRILVVTVALTTASCSGSDAPSTQESPAAAAGSAAAATAAATDWRTRTFGNRDASTLARTFVEAAKAELARPGVDPSDIKAAAIKIGPDPQRIFEFLRTEIDLEPYAGQLRGARGALAARAANALDRALLAKQLLAVHGIEARLVAGTLPIARARELLTRFLSGSAQPKALALQAAMTEPGDGVIDELASKLTLPKAQVAELYANLKARQQALLQESARRRSVEYDYLSSALQRAGKIAPAPPILDTLEARLRDHYWIQTQEPDGQWRDFDPSAAFGSTYGENPTVLDRVPVSKQHRFTLELLYGVSYGQQIKHETLLRGSMPVSDGLFEPVEFSIEPIDFDVEPIRLLALDDRQRIAKLRSVKKFQGFLRIGNANFAGRGFDLDGSTIDPISGARRRPNRGVADFLGGDSVEEPQFADVTVVLRFEGPDREPSTQTRRVVAAADITRPDFAPPVVDWQLLVQPQWITPDLAAVQLLKYIVPLVEASADRTPAKQDNEFPNIPATSTELVQLALLRQAATTEILSLLGGLRAFLDRPLLTIAGRRVARVDDARNMVIYQRTIDIVENATRFVESKATGEKAFEASLRQGVADCTLEGLVLGMNAPPGSEAVSGVDILDQARRQGRDAVVASASQLEKLQTTGLSAHDVAWIQAYEPKDGRVIAVATPDGPDAWWSVRPDGTSVLRLTGGGGQTLTEYAMKIYKKTKYLILGAKIYFGVQCIKQVISSPGSGPTTSDVICVTMTGASVLTVGLGWAALGVAIVGVEIIMHNTH